MITLMTRVLLVAMSPKPARLPSVRASSADLLGLDQCRDKLLQSLRIEDVKPDVTSALVRLHAERITPYEVVALRLDPHRVHSASS